MLPQSCLCPASPLLGLASSQADIRAVCCSASFTLQAFLSLLSRNGQVVLLPKFASITSPHFCKVAGNENERTNIAPGELADGDVPVPRALTHSESFELPLAGLLCYCMAASVQVLQASATLPFYSGIRLLAGKMHLHEGILVSPQPLALLLHVKIVEQAQFLVHTGFFSSDCILGLRRQSHTMLWPCNSKIASGLMSADLPVYACIFVSKPAQHKRQESESSY